MALEVLTGPPGSGKTAELLRLARQRAAAGERILWVGLPTQRANILSRLAQHGSLTGTEFISEQQLCYRLLSRARQLRPLRVGTERLALVGAALAEARGAVPQPGEARLFAGAIAELKRSGLNPTAAERMAFDAETQRLAEVFHCYEQLKADAWDYDDYRMEARKLAARGEAEPDADLLIVAGYRQLLPVMLELYADLGRGTDVRIALPELPALPEAARRRTVAARPEPETCRFRARNEIEEVRWVLRDVKQALAEGAEPAGLALVAPAALFDAFVTVAGEYGVPLAPERPRTLADTRAGRTLLELIHLQDFTGPAALLALPGLGRLAATALRERISGRPALLELARRLDEADRQQAGPDAATEPGLSSRLTAWLDRFETADADFDWAVNLLGTVCGEVLAGSAEDGLEEFREHALQRAREARQLGRGPAFRAWWAALIEDTHLPADSPAGVALLTPDLVSGRHYARAWLAGAAEGAYLTPPVEDYFLPEDSRTLQPEAGSLPRRFSGQEHLVLQEFLFLADALTVTYAADTQEGAQLPQPELLGSGPLPPLPDQAAASPAELRAGHTPAFDHVLPASELRLPGPEVEWLRFYGECPQRAWAEALLRSSSDLEQLPGEPWQELRRDLRRSGTVDAGQLDQLAAVHQDFADWLERYADLLGQLHFGAWLPRGRQPQARIDASGRIDGTVHLYRFAAPGSISGPEAAAELLNTRIAERWLASYLLYESERPEPAVRLFVWPVGEPPAEVTGDAAGRWLRRNHGPADKGFAAYLRGDVQPRPSPFRCRGCPVADMCRRSAA